MSGRREALRGFITAELLLDPGDELTESEDMLAGGRVDSFGVVRLVAFIGTEFSITVPNEDITVENFRSVEAIDRYLAGAAGD